MLRFEPSVTGQPDVVAVPCTQAAVRFAERSYAVQAAAAQQVVPPGEAYFQLRALQIARELAQGAPVAMLLAVPQSRVAEAALRLVAAVLQQRPVAPEARAALLEARVSQAQA